MAGNTSSIQDGRAIALDIGGTHSRAALFDGGRMLWHRSLSTPAQAGPHAMVDTMAELLQPVAATAAPVGVAIAGQVRAGRVTAHNAGLLKGWDDFPLEHALADRLGRSVRVLNDARAAASAEHRLGAGRGCRDFLFVTVSTGLGAGLLLGGRLHLAGNGLDAELGETLVAGGQTLENVASGTALGLVAKRLGFADARALADAADAGDPRAAAPWRDAIRQLALKLADLRVMLGIERTAIGGGVGLRPGYVEQLREELHRLPPLYHHEIMRAELGADAGLHGVAAWVLAPPDAEPSAP